MSLKAFKEALKPCNSTQSSSQSSSSSLSSLGFDPSIQSRKPPKSSLSRQLLRLHEDADFFQSNRLRNSKPEPNLNARGRDDKSQEEKEADIQPRKPPKSSLSRQLLRLGEDADFFLSNQPKISKPESKPEQEPNLNSRSRDDKCEEEKEAGIRPRDFKVESLRSFDHIGPYEPLVLSLPGVIPVLQVISRVPICL